MQDESTKSSYNAGWKKLSPAGTSRSSRRRATIFLGETLDAAVNAALEKHPDRLTHTIRIGHTAALHLGIP